MATEKWLMAAAKILTTAIPKLDALLSFKAAHKRYLVLMNLQLVSLLSLLSRCLLFFLLMTTPSALKLGWREASGSTLARIVNFVVGFRNAPDDMTISTF